MRDLILEWFSLLICENNYLSLFWSFARTRYTACCNAVCGRLRSKEKKRKGGNRRAGGRSVERWKGGKVVSYLNRWKGGGGGRARE